MRDRTLRALVYGDVNLNLIDGSAVWLASTAECLARCGVEVTVLLKAPVQTDRLLRPLASRPDVTLLEPKGAPRTPEEAADEVLRLHRERAFDLVVVRGSRAASAMVRLDELRSVLWTYLTDIPQSVTALDDAELTQLTRIVRGSRRVLCQTPELRTFLEAVVPACAGRTLLWEPIIPDLASTTAADHQPSADDDGRPLRVGYAGKFAPSWLTDRMLDLPASLAERGVRIDLAMVGDKIHRDDPDFVQRMEAGLADPDRVRWHGGLDRASTLALMASWDIGLSWRDPSLDSSLELSTKVLEYASMGAAPLLNRTPMHVRLLGEDYPLFVTPTTSPTDLLAAASLDRSLVTTAAQRSREVAQRHTMTAAVARVTRVLERAFPVSSTSSSTKTRPLRLLIAGHDLKFMRSIADLLGARPDIELCIDEWASLGVHDEETSRELLEWADVIVCEWAGPNVVWYSSRRRRDQRLLVRLHRFELTAPWIHDVDPTAVDAAVCVNDHYRERVIAETRFPADAVMVIPNAVDRDYLDRPKAPGADRVLGLLGMVPFRKRPDRALSILRSVQEQAPDFLLSIKSGLPWEYAWIWRSPEERAAYRALLDEITRDPVLRGSVVIEGHGADVPAWLQRTGWVLSVSEDESFHLAPAEGMAAGSVPLILGWPGADGVYDSRFVADRESELVERVLTATMEGTWAAASRDARDAFPAEFDLPAVAERWACLVRGDS